MNLSNPLTQNLYSMLRRALPQACTLCGAQAGDALICAPCMHALPRAAHACPLCALPRPADTPCARCLAWPLPWDDALAALRYAFPVDRLVQQLKYHGHTALGAWFGARLAASAAAHGPLPDVLIPVPLAAARLRERGYNQAHEIAHGAARALGIACQDALVRTRATPTQASLPWAARVVNVAGAFACVRPLHGLHVALVDDVMTTGATLTAAALALRSMDPRHVSVWVAARTA